MNSEQNTKNQQGREGGDEALSNLEQTGQQNTESQNPGYSNEERIAEDADGPNMPEKNEGPAGTGVPTKE